MKYAVVLCDGMADRNIKEIGNITPMEKANKSCMNNLASKSTIGLVKTVPDGLTPGSDVANLSVMGYSPDIYYSGRSPLEAASIGINLKDTDVTFRCNLVTLTDEQNYEDKTILDYCADDISTDEASILIDYLKEHLDDNEFTLYKGICYRHCLVWDNGDLHFGKLTPPHDITGKPIKNYIPTGDNVDKLYGLMKKSYELLKNHPVNLKRIQKGKLPANSIWFWGEGKKPLLDSFESKYGLKGTVISAVDLLKGIGICANMKSVDVEGATGYIDTNFEGKLQSAINEFKSGQDFVYIHLEAPDECSHRGELQNKIKAIEMIDEKIVAPLIKELSLIDDFTLLICPDHATPLEIKTHSSEPIPFLIYRSNDEVNSGVENFSEKSAKETGLYIENGSTLIDILLNNEVIK